MAAHQAPPSLGFSRQEHWSGLPFPSPMHGSEKWKWSHSVCPSLQDPMDCSLPAFSINGIFQAWVLEWVAISFSNVPLVSLIFLKRSLVFPILLFSSISLYWSLRKAFLSLLAILWNSAFRCLYLSFFPLLSLLLFTAICKASSDSYFACLHFFSIGIVLIPVSCTMSWTSLHNSSGTLSGLVP